MLILQILNGVTSFLQTTTPAYYAARYGFKIAGGNITEHPDFSFLNNMNSIEIICVSQYTIANVFSNFAVFYVVNPQTASQLIDLIKKKEAKLAGTIALGLAACGSFVAFELSREAFKTLPPIIKYPLDILNISTVFFSRFLGSYHISKRLLAAVGYYNKAALINQIQKDLNAHEDSAIIKDITATNLSDFLNQFYNTLNEHAYVSQNTFEKGDLIKILAGFIALPIIYTLFVKSEIGLIYLLPQDGQHVPWFIKLGSGVSAISSQLFYSYGLSQSPVVFSSTYNNVVSKVRKYISNFKQDFLKLLGFLLLNLLFSYLQFIAGSSMAEVANEASGSLWYAYVVIVISTALNLTFFLNLYNETSKPVIKMPIVDDLQPNNGYKIKNAIVDIEKINSGIQDISPGILETIKNHGFFRIDKNKELNYDSSSNQSKPMIQYHIAKSSLIL